MSPEGTPSRAAHRFTQKFSHVEDELRSANPPGFTPLILRPPPSAATRPACASISRSYLTNHAIIAARSTYSAGSSCARFSTSADCASFTFKCLALPECPIAGKNFQRGTKNLKIAEIAEPGSAKSSAPRSPIETTPTNDNPLLPHFFGE